MRLPAIVACAVCAAGCLSDPAVNYDAAAPDAAPPDAYRPDATVCTDGDGDGYLPEGCSATLPYDCNDGVGAIHPGAYDDCNSGADEDCVGGPLDCAVAIVPNEISDSAGVLNVSNGFLFAAFFRNNNYVLSSLHSNRGDGPEDDLLYTGGMVERLSGVSEWQDWYMWDPSGPLPGIGKISEGRAAVRFVVPWAASNGTGGPVGMSGTSLYTVYPDGRIHIDHGVDPVGDGSLLTAFIALHQPDFSNADYSNNAGAPIDTFGAGTGFYENDGDPADWLCAYDTSDRDLVGWIHSIPGGEMLNGPRMSEGFTGEPQLALQWDWYAGAMVPTGHYQGNFLVVVDRIPDTGPACGRVDDYAGPFQNPAVLDVESPGTRVVDVGDDDGDGFNEGGGFYEVSAGSANAVAITLNALGAVPPPTSAYYIRDMDFSVRDPAVSLNTTTLSHGRDYLFHVDELGDGWLYLGVPLEDNFRLVIEVPAS